MTDIKLINENGVIKGIDPETGEEVPVSFDELSTDQLSLTGAIHDIRDFGAVGDGSTDNTQAIQDAINQADSNGGNVLVPAGDFYFASNISLSNLSEVTVFGVGEESILRHDADDDDGLTGTDSSNLTLANFRLIGDPSAGRKQQGIQLSASSDVTVRGVTAEDWDGDGIVFFDGCDNCRAIANDVRNCGDNGINPGGTGSETTDCKVVNNHVVGTTDAGIHVSVNAVECVVEGNTVVDCGINFVDARGCTVSNNTVRNAPNDGVYTVGGDASKLYGNKVTGNTIINQADDGIKIADGEDWTISDNVVLGGDRGIEASAAGVSITDNLVVHPDTRSELSGPGLFGIVYSNSGLEQRASCSDNTVVGANWDDAIFIDDTHLSVSGNTCDSSIAADNSNADYNAVVGNIASSVSVGGTNSTDVGNIAN